MGVCIKNLSKFQDMKPRLFNI